LNTVTQTPQLTALAELSSTSAKNYLLSHTIAQTERTTIDLLRQNKNRTSRE